MANETIVKILRELAFLSELKSENPFKIRALENSARLLEDQPAVEDLVASGEIAGIPGVGKGTQAIVKEFVESGKVAEHEKLTREFPSTIFEVLKVRGLGPKKAKALYENLQIASLTELEYACRENRLLDLKGFGQKTQDNILKGIEEIKSHQGKVILPVAIQEAEELLVEIENLKGVEKVSYSGELRRHNEIISSLDFVAAGNPEKMAASLEAVGFTSEEEMVWERSLEDGLPVRVFLADPKDFGTELFLQTGPDEFVKGFGRIGRFASEEELFSSQKKEYVPAECRDLNLCGKELINEKDIRGVFHLHTKASDGINSLEEMVEGAIAMGLEYLGVSDHSQTAVYANGLDEKHVLAQKKEIEKLQKKYPNIRIFHGVESDILVDGSLDYSDDFLKNFDFVIASVHGQMKLGEKEMTKRLVKAVKNKYTTWLGHWTGRLLLGRAGYTFDQEEVMRAAAGEGTGIELNASPYRLDMDWRILPRAAELKIPVGIFPDAHSVAGLQDVKYGVWMARKAGYSAKNVVNTLPLKEMEKWLAQRN